jgi:hypothetical protein
MTIPDAIAYGEITCVLSVDFKLAFHKISPPPSEYMSFLLERYGIGTKTENTIKT